MCFSVWGLCTWVQMSSEARGLDPLGLESQTILSYHAKPTKVGSSARTAQALNHYPLSSATTYGVYSDL